MQYPNNCIRGIPKDISITQEGTPPSHLFYFKDVHREDGWDEQSINWEDDDSVIEFTLKQRNENGDIQFVNGVAVVSRHEIDRLIDRPQIKGLLQYERKPKDDNRYHGNILLKSGTSKQTMKLIASGIALAFEKIVPQAHNMENKR
jgi:hypothetical protein